MARVAPDPHPCPPVRLRAASASCAAALCRPRARPLPIRRTAALIRRRPPVLLRWAATASTLVVLGALALLGRPQPARIHRILVGPLPDALALDAGADRAIVANDADATVSLLDLAAGRVLRTVAVGPPGTFAPLAPALDPRAHRLFVADPGDNGQPSVVRVLDSRSGAPLATRHVAPGADAVAVDAQTSHVVVASEGDGSISLLDARTGRLLRTTRMGLAPLAVAVDPWTARAFVLGTALLPTGQPADGQAGLVGVLDTRTGALVRTVVVGQGAAALAVDAPTARVFVANSAADTVSVLDARLGVVLRTVRVGGAPAALAVDARDGRVFVANEEGTLSVLDAHSGALRRTVAVFPAPTISATTWPDALAVDAERARVYVTAWGGLERSGLPTESGQLAVLDARDGVLLRTLPLGVAPRAVAVQEDSGRLIVVDSGGVRPAAPNWAPPWLQRVVGRVPWLACLVPRLPAASRVPGSVSVIETSGW